MELKLGNNFSSSLECPICYEYYTLPIRICINGHSFCCICAQSSKVCPICRSALNSNSHNIALESILENISIPCKFDGCNETIVLSKLSEHFDVCKFNNYFKCIECQTNEIDIVSHLVKNHEYKEISMEPTGGRRSFSGPFDSWIRDTEWPKGLWRFGSEPMIVHACTTNGIFHVYLYRISKHPIKIKLSVKKKHEYEVFYNGNVPHLMEFKDKKLETHFNCDVNLLLRNFIQVHEEDEEILRLWIDTKRKVNIV